MDSIEFVSDWLLRWQTLVGAVIGGVMALFVALLVAYKARRHEEAAAAAMVISDMQGLVAAKEAFGDLAELHVISPEDHLLRMSDYMIRRRPRLSPLFDASMARLLPLDTTLTSLLILFRHNMSVAEQGFARLEAAEQRVRAGQSSGFGADELPVRWKRSPRG